MISLGKYFSSPGLRVISGAPDGSDAFAIAELLAEKPQQNLVYVARSDVRMTAMGEALTFFSPNEKILEFLESQEDVKILPGKELIKMSSLI